jgi:hypothetical protein
MKSDIEQSYIADIISSRYPASEPEGIVEIGELTRDPAQFSANATKREGGVGFVAGAAPAPMSSSSTAQVSQPRFGRAGVTAEQSAAAGGLEKPITALADMLAGIPRGMTAQTMGLGGDLESLYNGLTSIFNRPEDQPRIDAFLQGLAQKTNMATTEQINKEGYRIPFTDINMPPLPPVVPVGSPDQKSREASANYGQFFGELAPIPSIIDVGVTGLKAGAKALAPNAANMMEQGLRKSGMITDIVPDGKSVPQKIAPAQIKETGGLSFPSVDTDNRLRLKAKREESVLAGKASAGAPKNTRVEIQAPEGSSLPNFVVGNITPQDWIARTESMLSKEEISKYAKWYDDIKGTFLKYTNNDEAKADKYMRAWLVANQNIGVDGALSNMLLQAEQFARKVPKKEMKAGGLPMATQAARNALSNEPITEGVGAKISDFVDSAEGKSVRSFYGNNQAGGSPFVVDIHTARDTGLVDEILLNHLERKGYQVDRQNIKTDFAAGPTETQYENRADFGRALTKYLNDNSWQGRTDWTPKEVQAVGWMAMTKLTADAAEDSVTALERNLRRISMEVAPAVGSPWEKKFGEKFSSLPAQRQSEITQVVTDRAMQTAKEISGIDFREMVHGTGGWQTFQNPAAVAQTLATREGAEIAANVLGYLLQQTEVWVNSIKGTTKNPKSLAIDFIESGSDNLSTNEGIRSFWEKIMAADSTGLFVGYQPIKTVDGEIGIRVIVDKANATKMQNVQNALSNGGEINNVLNSLDFQIKAKGYESDLVKAGNNWKESPDGKLYLGRLADLGVKRTAADLDPIRSELEKIIESELAGTGEKAASAGTKSATAKAKQVIKRSQSAPLKGAE